jgi:hypothetical protein
LVGVIGGGIGEDGLGELGGDFGGEGDVGGLGEPLGPVGAGEGGDLGAGVGGEGGSFEESGDLLGGRGGLEFVEGGAAIGVAAVGAPGAEGEGEGGGEGEGDEKIPAGGEGPPRGWGRDGEIAKVLEAGGVCGHSFEKLKG